MKEVDEDERLAEIRDVVLKLAVPLESIKARGYLRWCLRTIDRLKFGRSIDGKHLSHLANEDRERYARAVLSVCDWGRYHSVYLTVDDAVNIVSMIMDEWSPRNLDEALRDRQVTDKAMVQLHAAM